MNILATIRERFRPVVEEVTDAPEDLLDMIRPAQNPRFGDYQANFAMSLQKRLGKAPREKSADLVSTVKSFGPGGKLRLEDGFALTRGFYCGDDYDPDTQNTAGRGGDAAGEG